MKASRRSALAAGLVGLSIPFAASCTGSTGDALVTFPAFAAGVAGASEPFQVNGYSVTLTRATMRIGAVYVNESPVLETTCVANGIYCAEVPGGVEVDLMSTRLQEFSVLGNGTADQGKTWALWLTGGDINAEVDSTHIVDLEGVATRLSDSAQFSFASAVTINDTNREPTASDPSQPGLDPVCEQRLVNIGGIALTPFQGAAMVVTVDPRAWFNLSLDFASLPETSSTDECDLEPGIDATLCIPDTSFGTGAGATEGREFFTSILTGGAGAYSIRFQKITN